MSLLRLCSSRSSGPATLRELLLLPSGCHRCLQLRTHLAGSPEQSWGSFRRNYSSIIPKKDDGKNQTWERARLLQVLKARMQQLQADNVTEMKCTEVQFVNRINVTHLESLSGRKNLTFLPDSELEKSFNLNTVAAVKEKAAKEQMDKKCHIETIGPKTTSAPSKWIEKLDKEKHNKTKRQLNIVKKMKESLPLSSMKNVTGTKSTGTGGKSTSKGSAAKTPVTHTASSSVMSSPHAVHPDTKSNAVHDFSLEDVLAEVENLDQQLNKWEPSAKLLEDEDGNKYGDTQRNILSYVDTCAFINDLDRAHQCVMFHHRILTRRKQLNVKIYSVLMHLWAKKGSLNQIGKLFTLVEEAGLKPNLDCYMAALECMGRMENCSSRVIERCLQQLKEDGFTTQDLFKTCVFRKDEREMVMKAICAVSPDFQLQPEPEVEFCQSPLVNHFYSKVETVKYPKLHLCVQEMKERFDRQLSKEQADTITIDSVEVTKPITEKMKRMRNRLTDLRAKWQKSLLQAFREFKLHLAGDKSCSWRMNLYPYLCLLDDKEYVDIMIQNIANIPPNGEALLTIAKELGNRIYNKYAIRKKIKNEMVDKIKEIYYAYIELLAKDSELNNFLPREYLMKLEREMNLGPSLLSEDSPWPHFLIVHLGTHLVDLMVREIKIPINTQNPRHEKKFIPVLYHMYSFRSNKQIGFIKPHPILTQILSEAAETTLIFDSCVMPMVCAPIPWTSPRFGAYVLTPTKLMRCVEGALQHQLLLQKCKSSDLHPVLDSLNQLGNCAWKVNKPMLDLIISIFNDKGSEKLEIPPPLSEAPDMPKFDPKSEISPAAKSVLKKKIAWARKRAAEMHSLRMDALYKLSIANHMRDDTFWFPHNMDFRGRTYPCPPYFNHLGSDVTRAVLLFAEGKPLGEHGLNWLKIHLVNLTGFKKKCSLKERLDYADGVMDNILDSADNPLTGRKWWMNADEPWQTLACCTEIAHAVRSPDPTKYISYFPVHQDGSCNGLQHYAALGRDVIGATSVNLKPCEVPQDVYSGVALQVEEFRKQDAEKGIKIAQILEGFINRKVVKQTVMTVVYGVTRFGGRLQIEKRLKEVEDFPKDHVWDASHYLVRQVFSSLKEMFTGTREIQDWLTESARLISKSGSSVQWVTPLGLPIVQPYHRTRTTLLRSNLQNLKLQISHDATQRPDTVKQKNAFAPNFIHSLDSTHMMLTALYCYSAGVTFVSVHDCFWTHAFTVDVMNKVCREQFVALHSQPILRDLSKFLVNKYRYNIPADRKSKKLQDYQRMMELLSKVLKTGEFDLEKVKESTYFFS
ncbi:DNA-directed RNA polymerase, mitochondrial isoform X1 [Carcharodon carcharias]|uniref:DNA-directed RNA polymerase, mitochondrial isoform X1 n=2 Tax=Carcharodon carcharias TaxID=13397 RepID=UPI001B7F2A31|nr:DNA-directed RNA polymerase, mitochondrial isoform X1 [Carcharodon carcharias]